MKSLIELAEKYGTDKKQSDHNYVSLYERILSGLKVHQMLEIGVGNGASLRMWNEYFPDAEIFGMELYGEENRSVWNSFKEEIPDVAIIEGDSTKPESWINVPNNLDLIIDDGDHHPNSQIATFTNGFNKLRSHGLYVIEDTHTNFEKRYTGGEDILYPWLMGLIVEQECPTYGSGGDHYKYQSFMKGISKDIFSYHFYKSLVIFEKA